jgi:protein-disulfide isomerase
MHHLAVVVVAFLLAVPAWAETVATVGDTPITRETLEKHVKPKLVEVENQRYEVLSEGLDELVSEQLLEKESKAKGVTVEQLVATEVIAKVAEPTDAEIQKVYDDNKAQLQGQTLEQVKPRIVEFLKQQKGAGRQQEYITELKGKYKTTVALKPPKVEVATAGRPARGGAESAPVTIIEFSDYECPYCKRAEETVKKVMATYGDKVRLVYRHYPLEFHANARPAAEASACAAAQGKFWEYHDKLMAASDLSEAKLKSTAGELGLDQAKFDECFAKKQFKGDVDKDMADASSVGVTGTPAFFINGRMLSGAQPFEKFKEVIDEELARAPSKS